MSKETRIPRAEITGLYGGIVKRLSRKMLGEVAEPVDIYWHNPAVLKFYFGLGQKSNKWDQCDENLKSFAHMAVASLVGCTWCLDFGYFTAHNEDLDEAKVREVLRWRESDVFTLLERDVMEYAEAMSQTPPTVTDELSTRLLDALGGTGDGGALGVHRIGQHVHADQRRLRDRGSGARRRLRPRTAGPTVGPSFLAMGDDPFVSHRSLLFTVAYEMLGSAADAEDVVQETWLRWAEVDQEQIFDPRAYLVRIATRLSLNRLRTLARQREDYVGEWLPEPLLTSPDVADDVVLAESVSMAMLTVLETLGPTERAVFVLREVFDTPYEEIAEAVGKTSTAIRQIAHRAREHVKARQPRIEVDRAEQQEVVERFMTAATSGDIEALLDVLAPDVVMVADGGGLVPAIRQPLEGAYRVVKAMTGFARVAEGAVLEHVWLNGAPALRIDLAGALDTAISVVTEDGRISHIYAVRNPHKLGRVEEEARLSRTV